MLGILILLGEKVLIIIDAFCLLYVFLSGSILNIYTLEQIISTYLSWGWLTS